MYTWFIGLEIMKKYRCEFDKKININFKMIQVYWLTQNCFLLISGKQEVPLVPLKGDKRGAPLQASDPVWAHSPPCVPFFSHF